MFSFSIITPGEGDCSCKASLLSFDNELKVLADISWNGENPNDILFLESYLPDVNLILLSHSTPDFIGGFALMCLKFPTLVSKIPIYSTLPVNQLGRISTVEYYRSHGILGPLKSAIMEVVDVDECFDRISTLKFFQSMSVLENKLTITPYNAGHTLGGTFWLITKRLEKIIYAPSWNHSKDSFLNSASFLSATTGSPVSSLLRPTALITNTDLGSAMSHKKRTEKFLQLVDATLANGGAVLLPTSISGRFLEILHLVDEHLQGAPIPVYFLSYSGTKVLSYASSLVEWMSTQLAKEYEELTSTTDSASLHLRLPFDPTKVDLLLDPNEIIQSVGPKIIFASGVDLNNGDLSTEALQYLCQDEKTTIILTEKSRFSSDNSINNQLFYEWYTLAKKKSGGSPPEDGVAVPLEKSFPIGKWTKEEPLKNQEIKDFEKKISIHRKQKLIEKAREKRNEDLLNVDTLNPDESSSDEDEKISSEEEDEEEEENVAEETTAATTPMESVEPEPKAETSLVNENLVTDHVKLSLEANAPLDFMISHKLKPRQAMFPYHNSSYKQKFDDYGEVIDVAAFQKGDDGSNNMQNQKKFDQNGRWGNDEEDDKGRRNGKPNNNQNKLTPQETLNNDVLKRYLDTLFKPCKRVPMGASNLELKARCGLSYVDLSGTVDMRSLSLIVSSLKPYNLLLLPDLSNPHELADELDGMRQVKLIFDQQAIEQQNDSTKRALFSSRMTISRGGLNNNSQGSRMNVYALESLKAIEIGGDGSGIRMNDFEVKLDDQLVQSLKWQKISGSYSVSQVYGELELRNPHVNKKQKTATDFINPQTEFTLKPILKQEYMKKQQLLLESQKIPEESLLAENQPKLAIGDIRLPELKKKLLSRDLNAEFKSEGTLVVNNTLAIRKVTYSGIEGDDTGDIVIDGSIGRLYYQVKDCIREMLAYV